jgi:hypothetical protein
MICNDRELAALDDEVHALWRETSKILAAHELAELHSPRSWRRTVEKKCKLPSWVNVPDALRVRPCVIDEYAAHIKKLANLSHPRKDRLQQRPTELSTKNIYFTLLVFRDTLGEAREEFGRLSADFPFEEFALYPPYDSSGRWTIVFSSYVDAKRHTCRVSAAI